MEHSKYGASGSYRWLKCPGSVILLDYFKVKNLPNKSAMLGTAAHQLADDCLKNKKDPFTYLGKPLEITKENGETHTYIIDEDMAKSVKVYYDYVKSRVGVIHTEQKISLEDIDSEMFGTTDAAISHTFLETLEIVDFKNGMIAVEPEENTQLMYYALGVIRKLNIKHLSSLKLTIIQPRAEGKSIKTWNTDIDRLNEFAKTLKEGVVACKSEAPELHVGSWCQYCEAKIICPEFNNKIKKMTKIQTTENGIIKLPDIESLTTDDISKILDMSATIESFVKEVKAHALSLAEQGNKIPNQKLVKARANRVIKNEKDAIQHFKNLGHDKEIFSKPKLLSPSQLEKAGVPKEEVAKYAETPDRGYSLVPRSDKRKEIVVSSLVEDFSQSPF